MKLYYSPNACSLGIHVLLEETGAPFTLQKLDFAKQEQNGEAFRAINPKGKVPTLELDDGTILTEWPAVAYYLAREYPKAKLLPHDATDEAKVLEMTDYLIATMHMRGFTRIFRPAVFWPGAANDEAAKATVQQAGRDIVSDGFKLLAPALAGKEYLLGEYSIADAALFFLEYWWANRVQQQLPAAFAEHLTRMLARPAVQRVLAAEGLA